ncbi:MAG: FAD-dependent monooxygenase, partial [Rhodobacteraceae bacterium]|nr:FAD-dependent monooxygenase [Paracoccaceae bacterium]
MPKNASDTDVIIVGAGPTGLLLANLLGTMGVRTTIIERNAGTVDEPRAVSIDDESMRSLQAAGLSDEVGAICSRGYGSIYKGPNGNVFATVKPFIKEYGFDKRNAFQQPEFEAILRAALERHDNVTAHFETEVTGFSQTSEAVKATVTFPDSESG